MSARGGTKRTLQQEVLRLQLRTAVLEGAVKELHWMARRYADGRSTYATSSFNQVVRDILRLGLKLHGNDGIIWARDAQGRLYDHLTPEEATPGTANALGICGTGGQIL
jgi:hypothetical protein